MAWKLYVNRFSTNRSIRQYRKESKGWIWDCSILTNTEDNSYRILSLRKGRNGVFSLVMVNSELLRGRFLYKANCLRELNKIIKREP